MSKHLASPEHLLDQAVERLYRALHLPRPGVVIAGDPAAFVDHIVTVTRRAGYERFCKLLALVLLLTMLALTGAALAKGDAVGLAVAAWGTLALVPMTLLVMGDPFNRVPHRDLLAIFSVCAFISGIGSALLTADYRFGLGGAVAGLAIAMIVGLCITILSPFARRIRLRRQLGRDLPILGSRPMHDVLRERVYSALASVQEQKLLGGSVRDAEPRQALERRQLLSSIGEARLSWHWRALAPLLGAASDGSTRGLLYTIERRTESVPELARAAVHLDELCDAVTLFEHVAVVLLPATQSEVDELARPQASRRRSRRPPYADILRKLGPQPILTLMIDLASSDERADRLLARRLLRIDKGEIMGLERLVAAARLDPVDRDENGELFVVGRPEHLVAFVRIRAEGGKERRLRVPAYVATAREGVSAISRDGGEHHR